MKQLVSILLSLLLLTSSTGIAYAQHFCGDYEMMAKITLGQKHLSCGMVSQDSACGDEHTEDHHCCDNNYTQISIDDATSVPTVVFTAPLQIVVWPLAIFQSQIVGYEDHGSTFYSAYDPPPLIKNIPVLYESFLI